MRSDHVQGCSLCNLLICPTIYTYVSRCVHVLTERCTPKKIIRNIIDVNRLFAATLTFSSTILSTIHRFPHSVLLMVPIFFFCCCCCCLFPKVGWSAEESCPLWPTTTSSRLSRCPPRRLVNTEVGKSWAQGGLKKPPHLIVVSEITLWGVLYVVKGTGNYHLNLQCHRVFKSVVSCSWVL